MTPGADTIRAALAHVPAHDRETWLKMGMAVKSELGDGGFDLWDEWSQADDSYREADARAVWRSIKPNGKVGVGTLYHEAQRRGFKLNGHTRPAPPTAAEREARERQAREREADEARRHEAAKAEAARLWAAASPAREDHPYLVRKGVQPHGIREHDGYLLIPLRDGGELVSLQTVAADGEKRFLPGGRVAGCYHSIGKPAGAICVAEGYATGATIHEATGHAVAVAFNAGNLAAVARALRAKYADAQIIICADDDYRTAGNPGMTKATEAARNVGGLVAVPDFGADRPEGATDFNDLARHAGAEAVQGALASARAPDVPDTQPAAASTLAGDSDVAAWPDPAPLPAELPDVEPFALDFLPAALRGWIADISDRVQCPPDFPAVTAMVAAGSVIGRRVAVFPKRFDDWKEYPNLWGAVVGNPGLLKSPAIQEAVRPLRELEREAASAHADAADSWERRRVESAILRDASKSRAKEAARKGKPFDVSGLLADDDEEAPPLRRYIVNDSTIEALGEVLRGNPNGTLVYQDELIGLLKLLDKEGNQALRGFYLAGWSGKEPHTFDRIGRGLNLRIDAVCLSLFGSIQPAVIGDYLRDAVASGGGDGLVARMSMLVWPDVSREWVNIDRFPDSAARDAARAVFTRLDGLTPEAVGAAQEPGDVFGLRFADDAQADFNGWREDFERRQRTGDDHPALSAHRNKFRKLVPALALICHLADNPGGGRIGRAALLRALAWADYLDSHARRAYASVMRADADGARELLKRIRRGDLSDPFRVRDVYRNGWSRLADPEQARRAVRMLTDFDYLAEECDTGERGGRPTYRYRVNPRAMT